MKRSIWIRWPIIFALSLLASCQKDSGGHSATPEIAGPCPGPMELALSRIILDGQGNVVGAGYSGRVP